MTTNVLEYLENSADIYPDKTVFFDENREFTYASFVDEAKRLGAGIREAAGGARRPVAILVDRSSLSLLSMFAVLYSGNYYAPVDDALTAERKNRILTSLDPALIILPRAAHTGSAADSGGGVSGDSADSGGGAIESLPDFSSLIADLPTLADTAGARRCGVPDLTDADPAYVLHTSGSTGDPKGILVTHRALIDFTEDYTHAIGIRESDVVSNQPPFSFDGSVRGVYPVVKSGASAYLHSKKVFTYVSQLADELEEKDISVLSWSTSAFHLISGSRVFDERAFPQTIRKVIVGGEALRAKHLNIWLRALPDAEYYNVYGPTEVIDCTYYKVDRAFGDFDPLPIGRPYPNKTILLLKERGEKEAVSGTAPKERGEICVRGSGIASGYYKDPARTAAAFTQNPLHDLYRDIVYRTGDIGEIGEDGLLYFIGRTDGQIKHMGYRIELGEIETAASGVEGIAACVCLHDDDKDHLILIYEGPAKKPDIMRGLRAQLPKYMLPNAFINREKLPRNANGKIDRAALKNEHAGDGEERP
jgi:amino acid adenylation domain-containing protein